MELVLFSLHVLVNSVAYTIHERSVDAYVDGMKMSLLTYNSLAALEVLTFTTYMIIAIHMMNSKRFGMIGASGLAVNVIVSVLLIVGHGSGDPVAPVLYRVIYNVSRALALTAVDRVTVEYLSSKRMLRRFEMVKIGSWIGRLLPELLRWLGVVGPEYNDARSLLFLLSSSMFAALLWICTILLFKAKCTGEKGASFPSGFANMADLAYVVYLMCVAFGFVASSSVSSNYSKFINLIGKENRKSWVFVTSIIFESLGASLFPYLRRVCGDCPILAIFLFFTSIRSVSLPFIRNSAALICMSEAAYSACVSFVGMAGPRIGKVLLPNSPFLGQFGYTFSSHLVAPVIHALVFFLTVYFVPKGAEGDLDVLNVYFFSTGVIGFVSLTLWIGFIIFNFNNIF